MNWDDIFKFLRYDYEGISMLSYEFMQRAFIGGFIIAVIAPLMGNFVVVRRMSLIGDSLSHVALSGVVLAALLGFSSLAGAFFITVLGSVFIFMLREKYRSYEEIALAVIMSGGVALASVLMGFSKNIRGNFLSYLFGSISSVSTEDIGFIIGLSVVIVSFIGINYHKLISISFDEDAARASGVNVDFINRIFVIIIALSIVVSMRIVGVLLISSMMVVPVAASMNLAKSFRSSIIVSVLIAMISVLSGITLSYYFDLASGGTIVLVSIVILTLSIFWKRR